MDDPFLMMGLQFSLIAAALSVVAFYLFIVTSFVMWGIVRILQAGISYVVMYIIRQLDMTSATFMQSVAKKSKKSLVR